MSRTEELSTKLRTMTYDHERLHDLVKDERDKATYALKDVAVFKSRNEYVRDSTSHPTDYAAS